LIETRPVSARRQIAQLTSRYAIAALGLRAAIGVFILADCLEPFTMTWISRRGLLAFLCALCALTSPALGQKGKPQPPPPPPPVPVHYSIHYWQVPTGGTGWFNQMNNRGQAVGWYSLPDGSHNAWLYDPDVDPNWALDLNALGVVGVPEGWVIASATGINDWGDITGYVMPTNDPSVRRGYVINMRATPPELKLIPVPADWPSSYGGDINNHGMVLGFIMSPSADTGVYLYQTGLHGDPSDELARDVGLNVRNPDNIQISDTSPAMFAGQLIDWTVFRYTDGTATTDPVLQAFPTLTGAGVKDIGAHGDFCGYTTVQVKRNTYQSVPFRVLGNDLQVLSGLGAASAYAINSRGDLLCAHSFADSIYWNAYGLFSLNSLVSGPATELTAWKNAASNSALDINDPDPFTGFSDVIGGITFSNGTKAYYTLTPVP
jgi:hypothetical protein